ncbi:MAG: hypothetical protein F4X74_10520 [Acidimicrobiia bacterium]|nr:hypothetical protein [Acidimicrobiia bacterium]
MTLSDMQGFMGAVNGQDTDQLDLILHVPGGELEAAQAIVQYLRTKFAHIRAIVPIAAMSAGTMIALACDEIVMGAHSYLGPIDPQLPVGGRWVPVGSVVDDFVRASQDIARDPQMYRVWSPILDKYPPGLLSDCGQAQKRTKRVAKEWLAAWMLGGDEDAAHCAAEWFANDQEHMSHNRPISRDEARRQRIVITDLENDPSLQEAALSVHHATMHSLTGTPMVKIIENHLRSSDHTYMVMRVPD